jgi:hypothetical protein
VVSYKGPGTISVASCVKVFADRRRRIVLGAEELSYFELFRNFLVHFSKFMDLYQAAENKDQEQH